MLSMFKLFRKKPEREGPRVYKQMAVSPEAHARIAAMAERKGKSIIDTVDKMVGVH